MQLIIIMYVCRSVPFHTLLTSQPRNAWMNVLIPTITMWLIINVISVQQSVMPVHHWVHVLVVYLHTIFKMVLVWVNVRLTITLMMPLWLVSHQFHAIRSSVWMIPIHARAHALLVHLAILLTIDVMHVLKHVRSVYLGQIVQFVRIKHNSGMIIAIHTVPET